MVNEMNRDQTRPEKSVLSIEVDQSESNRCRPIENDSARSKSEIFVETRPENIFSKSSNVETTRLLFLVE